MRRTMILAFAIGFLAGVAAAAGVTIAWMQRLAAAERQRTEQALQDAERQQRDRADKTEVEVNKALEEANKVLGEEHTKPSAAVRP